LFFDLPKEFPIKGIEQMDLGDAEARDDDLLLKCTTPLPMFQEITSGKKDIIHGYRGTGKSSVVRLLAEGKLKFDQEPGFKSHVLVIDEELSYRSIREYLNKQSTNGASQNLLLRVVWDLLICYRTMKFVQEDLISDSDSNLRDNINEIESLFGTAKKKVGFIELVLNQKKKIGIKLDANLPAVVDVYAALEPNPPIAQPDEVTVLIIVNHLKYLTKLLGEKKLTVHILLDRLDDFVVHEEYETQKLLLQQLLACQADYRSKYGKGRIKIVTFLRTDLFQRIDQQPLGPDKVAQRSLEIKWTPTDINRFVAKRIALNLLRALQKDSLQLTLDQYRCWVNREEIGRLEETKYNLANFNVMKLSHWRSFIWRIKLHRQRASGAPRASSFDDIFSEAVINSLIPRKISHFTITGDLSDIDLFDFLDTHFQLGFGQSTPRSILLYLTEVLRAAKGFYAENPDILVKANSQGEYNLFTREILLKAYDSFQEAMWDIQLQISGAYRPLIMQLSEFRRSEALTFKSFLASTKMPEDDVRNFLGFCTHTGLLQCINPRQRAVDREYKMPMLYQNIKKREV